MSSGRRQAPRRPAPRVHWVALGVVALLLGMLLTFYAFTHAPSGESARAITPTSGTAVVPHAVQAGGPVIDASQAGSGGARTPDHVAVLTFDDGPSEYTPQVLDVLEHYHVPATFFTIGSNIAGRQQLLQRMVRDGDEIGVHTFTHPDLTTASPWRRHVEISTTELAIAAATGYVTDLMRLPYSSVTSSITPGEWSVVQHEPGYRVVFADRDSQDWARPGVPAIVDASMPQSGAGAVIMMHDGGGNRSQTVAALRQLIPTLLSRGYRFETVSHSIGISSPWSKASTWDRLRGSVILDATLVSRWLVEALNLLFWISGGLALVRTLILVIFARRHVRRSASAVLTSELPSVTVVVPAYNEQAGIGACVRSIAASNYPDFEIIVVDDGSTDDTVAVVEALALPGVRVITQENSGKPGALSTGINAGRHDIFVLVDGDTVFERDTIQALVRPLLAAHVGAVSGNTKVGNRKGLIGRWQHIEYVIGFNLDRRLYDELECMPTVPGAVGAFRRQALEEAGGVSDDTLAEDTDLTMAICRAGWRVVYAEDARAWTEAPASLGALWRQRYRWCYGTLQATWKHRHSVVERGRAGHLGRRGLPYLLAFQVILPLVTPVLDVAAVVGLFTGHARELGIAWLAFQVLQMLSAVYAFRLDKERLRPLWALPVQTLVYRQLMYLVVIQSVANALYGGRLRWHKLERTGDLSAAPSIPAATK